MTFEVRLEVCPVTGTMVVSVQVHDGFYPSFSEAEERIKSN